MDTHTLGVSAVCGSCQNKLAGGSAGHCLPHRLAPAHGHLLAEATCDRRAFLGTASWALPLPWKPTGPGGLIVAQCHGAPVGGSGLQNAPYPFETRDAAKAWHRECTVA